MQRCRLLPGGSEGGPLGFIDPLLVNGHPLGPGRAGGASPAEETVAIQSFETLYLSHCLSVSVCVCLCVSVSLLNSSRPHHL